MVRAPSPEKQAQFFTKLQRLLTAGSFSASYKYALLIALARWAVEHPDHDESREVDVNEFVPHFLELYWPQVRPFQERIPDAIAAEPAVEDSQLGWPNMLSQGDRLIVLREVHKERSRMTKSPALIPGGRLGVITDIVGQAIVNEPLWKLHRIARHEEIRFLYRRGTRKRRVVFEDGAVGCLAAFAPLLESIVQGEWIAFVLRKNRHFLGGAADLAGFLFPGNREGCALQCWRDVLLEHCDRRCFYCGEAMQEDVHVDHFLPYRLYHRDLGHNFVLADSTCNVKKRDHLASCEHLKKWVQRNELMGDAMSQSFDDRGLPHDVATTRCVAESLYRIVESAGSPVWHLANHFVPLDPAWRTILGVA